MAFDGERERALSMDEDVWIWVERDGPRRVDVTRCLQQFIGRKDFGQSLTDCRNSHAD